MDNTAVFTVESVTNELARMDFRLLPGLSCLSHGKLDIYRVHNTPGLLVYCIDSLRGTLEFTSIQELQGLLGSLKDAAGQPAYQGQELWPAN